MSESELVAALFGGSASGEVGGKGKKGGGKRKAGGKPAPHSPTHLPSHPGKKARPVSPPAAGGAGGAAWEDSDDEGVEVDVAGTNRLRKLRKAHGEEKLGGVEYAGRLRERLSAMVDTEWAKLPEDGGDAGDAIAHTGRLVAPRASLPRGTVDIMRQRDANYDDPSKAVLQIAGFHPTGRLLLTAGYDKRVRLFQVDGVKNPKVQSVFFKDLPIRTARFTPSGQEIIVAGRRKYFYAYDVVSGKINRIDGIMGRTDKSLEQFEVSPDGSYIVFYAKGGYVVLVSMATKQWVANLKTSSNVRSMAFTDDGLLLVGCDDGQVSVWNLATKACLTRLADEGSACVTALATSPDGQYFAAGSSMGVVNIYEASHLRAPAPSTGLFHTVATPKPVKALLHLTTRIDHLAFHPSSEMLVMASQAMKDSLRLVHIPSFTVFSNWPTSSTPLHYLSTVVFSPNGGYLVCGNDRGRALLFRLNHFAET